MFSSSKASGLFEHPPTSVFVKSYLNWTLGNVPKTPGGGVCEKWVERLHLPKWGEDWVEMDD